MCFSDSDSDDDDRRSIHVTEYRSRPLRASFPPRVRQRCPSPPLSPPARHCHNTTTIIYPPRPSISSSHYSPPHSPRASYTTITRKHVRTRQETIYPVWWTAPLSRSHRECAPPSPRYVEYVEPGRRQRGWEEADIEYIPIR
ncbi:hypothetical protein BJX76DRAFT_327651 [Aspergillus varians]